MTDDRSLQAAAAFDIRAEDYQRNYFDVSAYSGMLDSFLAGMPQTRASMADLACGPGNYASYILERRPSDHYTGIDLSPNMISLAQKVCPTGHFETGDARVVMKQGVIYDGILLSFLFPYLPVEEVRELLRDCRNSCHPDSIVYISLIEGDYASSGYTRSSKGDLVYMHYYSETEMRTLFHSTGFMVLSFKRLETTMANGQTVNDLVFLLRVSED